MTVTPRGFALGLGLARVAAGVVEVVAPDRYLALLGGRPSAESGALLAFRMKGARDLALGAATLAARAHPDRLRVLTSTAILIDAVDGLAVVLDRGRTLRVPAYPAGAAVGFGVSAAAAWAVARLGRNRRPPRPTRATPTT